MSDAIYLKGKKILLITPKFYHYPAEILAKMRAAGADVRFFYERDTSLKYALINRFKLVGIQEYQRRHFNAILEKTAAESYDYLVVVRGFYMPVDFIKKIKERNPSITTIYYAWDSIDNWQGDYRYLIQSFDKVATFDYRDAVNENIKYVPTFHTDELTGLPKADIEYDIFYFGSFDELRRDFQTKLESYCREHKLRCKTFLYISPLRFVFERLRGKKIDRKKVSFRRMEKGEYLDILSKSKVIVDVCTPKQSGLSMRILDALAAGKLILTTNKHIELEPGLDPRQYHVFDLSKISLPEKFLQREGFESRVYSIDLWIRRLMGR